MSEFDAILSKHGLGQQQPTLPADGGDEFGAILKKHGVGVAQAIDSRSAVDIARDVGVTALKGAVGLPEAIVGLADIPTGGRVGKALEGAGVKFKETQDILSGQYSEQQQAANKKVKEADGFVDTTVAALQNPSTIATTIGESIPQMLGGAGVARWGIKGAAKLGKTVAPWIAGAVGEGTMAAGSAAENMRQESSDGLLSDKQAVSALGSGAGTALLGAAGGKLAQKFGFGDIDTILAQGGADAAVAGAAKKGFLRQMAEGGISEGVFEEMPQSTQETMWQNWANDKPLMEGTGNAAAMGMLAGIGMGIGGGGYNAAMGSAAQQAQQATVPPAATTPPAATPQAAQPPVAPTPTTTPVMPPVAQTPAPDVPTTAPTAAPATAPIQTQQAPVAPVQTAPVTPVDAQAAINRIEQIDTEAARLQTRADELSDNNDFGDMFDVERQAIAAQQADLLAEREQIAATFPEIETTPATPIQESAPEPVTQPVVDRQSQFDATQTGEPLAAKPEQVAEETRATQSTQTAPEAVAPVPKTELGTDIVRSQPVNTIPSSRIAQDFETAETPAEQQAIAQEMQRRGMEVKNTEFDVSTRTNEQIAYLSEHGKQGWKEAAIAEAAVRGIQVPNGATNETNAEVVAPSSAGASPDVPASGVVARDADVGGTVGGSGIAADAIPAGGAPVPVRDAGTPDAELNTWDMRFGSIADAQKHIKARKLKQVGVFKDGEQYRIGAKGQTTKSASNNLLQRIKQLGGINKDLIADITGEQSKKGTQPGLFRKRESGKGGTRAGLGLDDLATMLAGEGFPINLEDAADNGGVNQLAELIRDAMGGNTVYNYEGMQEAMRQEADANYRENLRDDIAGMAGAEPAKNASIKQLEALRDKLRANLDHAQQAQAKAATIDAMIGKDMTDADWELLTRERDSAQFSYDKDIDAIRAYEQEMEASRATEAEYERSNREATGKRDTGGQGQDNPVGRAQSYDQGAQEKGANAAGNQQEPVNGATPGSKNAGAEELTLTGETPEQIKAKEETEKAAKKKADAEAKAAEDAAREKRIAKEVADRQKASAENFVLGQGAEDALAGQGDLLSAPIKTNQTDSKQAESQSAKQMQKGDRFTDGQGKTWEIWNARTSLIEAFPVIDGKIRVNNQDGQRWATDARARSANPEARTDFNPIDSKQSDAQSAKSVTEPSQADASKPATNHPSGTDPTSDYAKTWDVIADGSQTDWKLTLAQFSKEIDAKEQTVRIFHKESVSIALKQGKPVPANVLADYPDLKQPAPVAEAVEKAKAPETAQQKAADVVAQADAIEPAKPSEERIGDFGRKVEVRKDTAVKTGPKLKMEKAQDERPVWARRIIAMQSKAQQGKWQLMEDVKGGKGLVRALTSERFDSEQAALDAIPHVVAGQRHRIYSLREGGYGIYRVITDKKRALVKGVFDSIDAAKAYVEANPVEIIEHKFDFPERPWLDKIERTGPDRRSGKPVTKQMFIDTFAPGGVVYGNWLLESDGKTVNSDGQELSNYIYDSLLDLADAIKVPPKALFLDGNMVLGIGADGKGGKNSAAAHFSPDKGLINLTKIKGAGSLAHEWWHAVDDYFGKQQTNKTDSVVANGFGYKPTSRPELIEAVKQVIDKINYATRSSTTDADLVKQRAQKRIDDAVSSLNYYLRDLRSQVETNQYGSGKKKGVGGTPAQMKQWDSLEAKLRDGDLGEKVYVENPSKMRGAFGFESGKNMVELNALFKAVTGRSFLRQDPDSTGRSMQWTVKAIDDNKVNLTVKEDVTTTAKGRTDYYIEARKIDGEHSSDYWSKPEELGARAFESYIFDKLTEGEKRSDYLVYAVENRFYALFDKKPYPEGDERKAINSAFDNLFNTIQTKETDRGVAMFSRATPSTSIATRDLKAVVARVKKSLANLPTVHVLTSPDALDRADASQSRLYDFINNAGALNDVEGATHEGEIYLFASGLADEARAEHVLATHEITHYGLRAVFGSELDPVLQSIWANNANVRQQAEALRKKLGMTSNVGAVEEVLADMKPADLMKLKGWRRLASVVRNWFRSHGFTTLADKIDNMMKAGMTEQQQADMLVADVVNAARDWVKGGKRAAKGGSGTALADARLSRASQSNNRQANIPGVNRPTPQATPSQANLGLQGGVPGNNASWNAPEDSVLDNYIFKLQDKYIDLKRVTQAIKEAGVVLKDRWNAYLQEELFHGRIAKRIKDFVDKELAPLMHELERRGITLEQMHTFLWARHAQEANDLIRQRDPNMPDGGSGLTDAQARDILAGNNTTTAAGKPIEGIDVTKRADLEAIAAMCDAIIARTRDLYVSYELESRDTVDGWAQMFQYYVPLMRKDNDGGMGIGQGFSIKGREAKHRTGSSANVVDILANIATQRERAIVRGEKNRVVKALAGLVKLNPNPGFWSLDRIPKERVLNEKTGLVETREVPNYRNRDNVVMVKIKDGRGNVNEHVIVMNEGDERAVRLAKAMKNIDVPVLEGWIGASAVVTRYFSSINTQYNPVFGFVNLTRDLGAAALNLKSTPMAGKAREILAPKRIGSALLGIYRDQRAIRKGGTGTSQWSTLWEEFTQEGGQTGYRDMFRTSADRADDLKSMIDPMSWTQSKWGKFFSANGRLNVPLSVAQKSLAPVFHWLDDFNLTMENAVRLSAYKSSIDAGMSKQQAASLAKNLTVNFNRKGSYGAQIGAFYAFFNASTQGTARIAETMLKRDSATGKYSFTHLGKQITYGGMMVGAVQALALAMAGYDDDEPPEFIRERNLIIPIPETDGKYITIPMPLGFHILPNIGRKAMEYTLGRGGNLAETVTDLIGSMFEAFNPIGSAGLSMQTIAPTILDPMAALTENKDWTGKPIAKQDFNSLAPTPGFTRARDNASALSTAIAEGINSLTGGGEYAKGVISPTPDQIDYLFGQVTGGVGRESNKLIQTIEAPFTGEDLPPHKIPLFGRFYGNTNSQSAQRARYYDNLKEMSQHKAEIVGRINNKDAEGKRAYLAEHPKAKLYPLALGTEEKISQMRAQKRAMLKRGISGDRIKKIDDKINQSMSKVNERIESVTE